VRFEEGETVRRDMEFKPMALLKGRVLIDGKPAARQAVSHPNTGSIYGQWEVRCDKDGRFELPVPTGDVTVRVANRHTQLLKGIKPHEVRQVELKFSKTAPKSPRRASGPQPLSRPIIRIVGPDGATVPRPDVKWTIAGRPAQSHYVFTSGPAVDGTVELWNVRAGQKVEFTSPFLNKPVVINMTEDVLRGRKAQRVRLDRVPDKVPPLPTRQRYFQNVVSQQPVKAPETATVGEPAPELNVQTWHRGGPLSLAKLRGRVVLLTFDSYSAPRDPNLRRLAARFKDRGLTIILFQSHHLAQMRRPEPAGEGESAIDAIANDLQINGDWRGYNARRYGSEWGVALIGRDGRLAARKFAGPLPHGQGRTANQRRGGAAGERATARKRLLKNKRQGRTFVRPCPNHSHRF
jgi:hypothetical protein